MFHHHGQQSLGSEADAVPVHDLVPVVVICNAPTLGSALTGVATTLTQSPMERVPEPAGQASALSM